MTYMHSGISNDVFHVFRNVKNVFPHEKTLIKKCIPQKNNVFHPKFLFDIRKKPKKKQMTNIIY